MGVLYPGCGQPSDVIAFVDERRSARWVETRKVILTASFARRLGGLCGGELAATALRIEFDVTDVLVLNGPNLNLLGTRKPEVYGTTTLADVEAMCREEASKLGLEVVFRQSNHEGQLIDWIHEYGAATKAGRCIGAVYNPGAHTHTSVAIRDAIEAVSLPVIETHISNVHNREEFRHNSYISPVAAGIVVGFGVNGYVLAMNGLVQLAKGR